MAEIEDTPPTTEPLPTLPRTSPLPPQVAPATLPDPADLRPGGPARRWTWLLGGITAGAGAAALVLGLVANLVTPTATASAGSAASPSSAAAASAPPSSPASPSAAPYTALPAGCSLVRPETLARYAKGAPCTEGAPVTNAVTMSSGSWTSLDSGMTTMQVIVTLSGAAGGIYQQTLSSARTLTAATMKITDDRAVPGIGEQATLLYTVSSGYGSIELVVLQRNAVIIVKYRAATRSGYTLKDVPPSDAEAAATAAARDALNTLTAS
ncbi:hypothetical protein [Kitasatospora sp. NPDC089509]|uniref:hypothetical protein n=1 Tax=Kitasatospora sp. NPDC089509 TaxID=3364079 RepID=UPI00381DC14E